MRMIAPSKQACLRLPLPAYLLFLPAHAEDYPTAQAAAQGFINTDYYAPDIKLVLAKEYRVRDGSTT